MDLSTAPIRTMEAAITDRLRLAFPRKTFTIERVPQTVTIKEFERISRLSPFIGLAWMGFRPDGNTNGRLTQGKMSWRLTLVFKASNSNETRFKGDTRGIGLDAMIDVAVLLMNGAELPNIGAAQVTGADSVIADGWGDDQIVIAQVDFSVQFSASVSRLKLIEPGDFAQLGIGWSVLPEDEDAPPVSETLVQPED